MPATPSVPLAAATATLMLGGSSTFLVNLARALHDRGSILPVVVLTENIEHVRDFPGHGSEVTGVPTGSLIYEDRLRLGYQHIARHRPSAVLACLSSESFEILRLLPPNVARLGIIQSDDPAPYQMAARYAPVLDAMIGVSTVICDRLRARPEFSRTRIECIPYGIHFPPPANRPTRPPSAPVRIVYVGRLIEEQKRISRVAALIRILHERQVSVEWDIIGSGPDEAAFRAAVKDVPGIRLRGSVPYAEVAELLREQDLFVLLSDFEGLPLSLLEAMGAGIVPIISDLESGIRELVTNECGVRVAVGDVTGAATAIEELVRAPDRLRALGVAAAARARASYGADRMAERYLGLIDTLTHGPLTVTWPETVRVPVPVGIKRPWLYQGVPRALRRWIKRIRPRGPALVRP